MFAKRRCRDYFTGRRAKPRKAKMTVNSVYWDREDKDENDHDHNHDQDNDRKLKLQ